MFAEAIELRDDGERIFASHPVRTRHQYTDIGAVSPYAALNDEAYGWRRREYFGPSARKHIRTGVHAGSHPAVKGTDQFPLEPIGDEIAMTWDLAEETDAIAFRRCLRGP